LLDEPLSNLDAKLREETKLELMELQRALGFTAVYVTHDQGEALSLSDRIVILNEGRIEQIAEPEFIWSRPASPFVAEFIGDSNSFGGVLAPPAAGAPGPVLHTTVGISLVTDIDYSLVPGQEVQAFVAFDDVEIAVAGAGEVNVLDGRVRLTSFQGHSSLAKVEIGEVVITARVPSRQRLQEGERVSLRIPPKAITCFPASPPPARVDDTASAGV
jgi:ABC-type Fe3+/spermidine/putrescine transport system ATPase subunit